MSLRDTKQSLDRCRPSRLLREQLELHCAPGRATAALTHHHHELTRSGHCQLAGRFLVF